MPFQPAIERRGADRARHAVERAARHRDTAFERAVGAGRGLETGIVAVRGDQRVGVGHRGAARQIGDRQGEEIVVQHRRLRSNVRANPADAHACAGYEG